MFHLQLRPDESEKVEVLYSHQYDRRAYGIKKRLGNSLTLGCFDFPILNCLATFLLATSILLWICLVPLLGTVSDPLAYGVPWSSRSNLTANIMKTTAFDSRWSTPLLPTSGWVQHHFIGKFTSDHNDRPYNCVRPAWQSLHFPTCNDIHEIDLVVIRQRQLLFETQIGLVNNGFWRTVWMVNPRDDTNSVVNDLVYNGTRSPTIAALKIMRSEHGWDTRNLDRHRRDSLVMERLTASPYIVDIYGHCGTTMLTEYIEQTLKDIIFPDSRWKIPHQQQEKSLDPISVSGYHASNATRSTPEGRVQLSLAMMRGLSDLHGYPDGPIIHTDITAKQFLVTADGRVKLNDFNRCRFVANGQLRVGKNSTIMVPCPFHIADAPGKSRAPEEYNYEELNEKLDVYSAGNILYQILTGTDPHEELTGLEAQQYVKDGYAPLIEDEIKQNSYLDSGLANLTEKAFAFRPHDRITSSDLVHNLESLLCSTRCH
jgi:serine/threonine protein kinase